MSMWVMAASPLLTCTDVRNMTAEVKTILTNPEVLAVHKDSLSKMAVRVDIGGGLNELRSSNICSAGYPACQEAPGQPGYLHPCNTCRSNYSVYEKPLSDNSSAVMVLNRGETPLVVPIQFDDLGDSMQAVFKARDLWSHTDLGVFSNALSVVVPAHGVRLLKMQPPSPAPPPSPQVCPSGWVAHQAGLWQNPWPCGLSGTPGCHQDNTNVTMDACAHKCSVTKGCLGFEVYQVLPKACYLFVNELKLPFIPDPDCATCLHNSSNDGGSGGGSSSTSGKIARGGGEKGGQETPLLAGFQVGMNGTFLLNGAPIRLFAGSLQHFRIHPDHWEHRLALAKAMGLNAVQTLIPWMMMEPTPGEFVTDGFMDIVKFAKLCQAAGLLIVLRPGPFICDGPDYGGFPWWLTQQNTPATTNPDDPGSVLRVRSADPAFLNRVDLFFGKLFALLREENLTADLGGPIIMAQVDNEYGLFGTDQEYLQHIRATWRQGLGNGVVIHSTDPASGK